MEALLQKKLTKEEKLQFAAEWYHNFPLLCRDVFADSFPVPFSPLHEQMFEVMLSKRKKKKLILAPRGIGKTTIGRTYCMDAILHRKKHFIVYFSNSLEVAEMQTENMKRELMSNPLIREFYGNPKDAIDAPNFSGMDESFSKKSWVAFGSIFVLPRGIGQQVRGLNWNGYRPDLLFLDDIENRKELNNEVIRKENRMWLLGDVMFAMDSIGGDWEIVYLDTLKHEDALPIHLSEMSDWETVRLSICDPVTMKSNAPAFRSDKEIEETYRNFKLDGMLDVFYREFLNIPTAPETAGFSRADFRYYQESDLTDEELQRLENVIILDPANTATPKSDDSAMVGIGIDAKGGRMLIRDVESGKFFPDELFQKAVNMCRKLGTRTVAYEANVLSMHFGWNFKNWLSRMGMYDIELVELKPRGRKKENRIASGLIPLYKRHMILHNRTVTKKLEEQLLSFPNSKNDDVMDATAYIADLMDKGGRYFFPINQVTANLTSMYDEGEDIDEMLDELEAEYAILDNDEDSLAVEELAEWPI